MKRRCDACRHWSELLAQSFDAGPIEAMCLNPVSMSYQKYTRATATCPHWQENSRGATDWLEYTGEKPYED